MGRVLVVDDSATQAALITAILFQLNHEFEVAHTGTAGLAKALQGNYDLLVLDLNLPDMTGLEICQNFKAAGNSAPVLLVTTEDHLSRLSPNMPSGPDFYCVKEPQTLKVRLQTIFIRLRRPRTTAQLPALQASL